MGRSPCCSKEGINRGTWTASEDKILTDYIKLHGERKWRNIPKQAGLKRCGKSCRLRWMNYLRLDIKRGNISSDEEDLIIRLHKLLGNRWSLIAGRLPGRTDNEIKNYWNTHLSKRGQDKKPKPKPKPPSMDANLVQNVAAESESSDGSLTTLTSRNEKSSLEFMVDMNAGGETSVSEIFASDFTKLSHDLGASDMYNVMLGDDYMNTIAQSQAFVPPEEMEQNWGGSDCNIQANLDLDFGCLVDFLESAEEWII